MKHLELQPGDAIAHGRTIEKRGRNRYGSLVYQVRCSGCGRSAVLKPSQVGGGCSLCQRNRFRKRKRAHR
jgi:hypothetical protein